MNERKPWGTKWEPWIESQLKAAAESGAFDNLPGAGKPLPENLGDPYERFAKQLFEREQLSPLLPPSLELVRKVRSEIASIGTLPDEASVRDRVAALNAEIAKLNATMVEGPPTRLGLMDADEVVARWRRTRASAR
jgi:hypothetical protein